MLVLLLDQKPVLRVIGEADQPPAAGQLLARQLELQQAALKLLRRVPTTGPAEHIAVADVNGDDRPELIAGRAGAVEALALGEL